MAMCCRAPSIPEAQDLSRSSSNASSFASVVEEHEGDEDYDTGQVNLPVNYGGTQTESNFFFLGVFQENGVGEILQLNIIALLRVYTSGVWVVY